MRSCTMFWITAQHRHAHASNTKHQRPATPSKERGEEGPSESPAPCTQGPPRTLLGVGHCAWVTRQVDLPVRGPGAGVRVLLNLDAGARAHLHHLDVLPTLADHEAHHAAGHRDRDGTGGSTATPAATTSTAKATPTPGTIAATVAAPWGSPGGHESAGCTTVRGGSTSRVRVQLKGGRGGPQQSHRTRTASKRCGGGGEGDKVPVRP